jgi:hypothetical protein
MIFFLVGTGKKGLSSTGLSKRFSLQQKTCCSFKRKVMASSGYIKLIDTIDVDEFFVEGYIEVKVGLSEGKKIKWLWALRWKRKE